MSRGNAARWAAVVSRWQRSGLTRVEFARLEGVNANTLSWWKWKLGADQRVEPIASPATTAVHFVELPTPGQDRASAPRLVVVAGRFQVEVPVGFDGPTLAEVLGVLEECW